MNRFIALAAIGVLAVSSAAQSNPRQAADAPEQASDPNEKIVCKSFTRIGTLASRYRTCKTKGEWERERINLRQVNVTDSCSQRWAGPPVSGTGSPAPRDC